MDTSEYAILLAAVSSVVAFLAHLRIKSKCCGKEVSVDMNSEPSPKNTVLQPLPAPANK